MKKAVLAGLLLSSLAFGAGSRVYRNQQFRIRSFDPPQRWTLSEQPSYPHLLCSYAHPEGGKITLMAQAALDKTADIYAKEAKVALEKEGYRGVKIHLDAAGRTRLDAQTGGGPGAKVLRQVYLVDNKLFLVISIAGPESISPQLAHDLEETLRNLVLDKSDVLPPENLPPVPLDGGTAP